MKKTSKLLALTALVAGSFALTGCDKPAEPTNPVPESGPVESATPAEAPAAESAEATPEATPKSEHDTGEEKVLNLFVWSEYVPQAVIDKFSNQTGIKVNVENYASNEEMLAKLLASGGQYDLIQPSEYTVEALIKADLLRPIDKDAVPNAKNIAPEFTSLPFDPGNKYSIPWMAGTVGIVVNTEMVTDPVESYDDVFQEKYAGKIVVLDDAREITSWALESLDIPVNEVTDENLAKAKTVLEKWLPMVKVYDSDSPKTALLNGDVAVGIVWSGEGAILLNEAPDKFKWTLPAEGAHLFVDSLAIPKTAKHPKNAELFMNFILRPAISLMVSEEFPYLNPNAAARKEMSPEQLGNAAAFPTEEELARMETFEDIGTQASAVDEMVTTVKVQ